MFPRASVNHVLGQIRQASVRVSTAARLGLLPGSVPVIWADSSKHLAAGGVPFT